MQIKNIRPRSGFTLIELILVIAILGVISALAIQKLSGLKEDSQQKINRENVKRLDAAVQAYYVANTMDDKRTSTIFNRLDSLTVWDAPNGSEGSTDHLADVAGSLLIYTNQTANLGLSGKIASAAAANQYAQSGAAGVLGVYYLTAADARALTDFGLKYVMRGYPENSSAPGNAYASYGEDSVYAATASAENPDTCSCLAATNYPGMPVAVVNPAATVDRSPVGPDIYRSLGQEVAYSGRTYKVMVDGADMQDNQAAFNALLSGSGVLLAFGIGEKCALVGNPAAGLDAAPVSPVMKNDEYRRYIMLLRLKHSSTGAATLEYAGVMDPEGRTYPMLK